MAARSLPLRATLLLSLGLIPGALFAQAPAAMAERPAPPVAWTSAPFVPLWTGTPPGGGFRRVAVPADSPATFLRNIDQPGLRLFRPAHANGASVLVIPGGAYDFLSIGNEGVEIAERLNALGYTVYVLVYRLPGEGWANRSDVPLQDAQRGLRMVRAAATKDGLDPHRVAVLGFSAGGHLAATLETDFAQAVYRPTDAIDRVDARPDAAGLIYPVIAAAPPFTHALSAERLLGKKPGAAAIARRSPASHVTATTPPTFLLHAMDDGAVVPDNSMAMMAALRRAGRPVEAHFVAEGGHGFGVGSPTLPVGHWVETFDHWLQRIFATATPPVG
ncbi:MULTISPECIES: alpha/beta hydrolase [unclassified Sphingomonas]|uniref:alpha/beta hydrolase n=1 Tax=unclassified Sphingomonas TaxID=196159 RepID=UPI0006F27EE4|nr:MULTISPECIES: alpha/beta hydrolase [unclassified Sphingomonas]KQM61592.1 esterase [Sphingomonas sp. Leaf16]KQN12688.1 esterase [Sphingomonas sp. Leaf29]KQN19169.1 esterase [Sphingomonas sp. Leaf32]